MANKEFTVGTWVHWKDSDGTHHVGCITGPKGVNRENNEVYPIELVNGLKSAVKASLLEPVPHARKGKMSDEWKKKQMLKCKSKTMASKQDRKDIPLDKLIEAREKEIESLNSKLDMAATREEKLKKDLSEALLQIEILKEDNAKLKAIVGVPNEVVDVAISDLQTLVDGLLSTGTSNEVISKILPIIYHLLKR